MENKEVESAFYDALALAGVTDFFVKAELKPFSSLRADARADREKGVLFIHLGDGYSCAPHEALMGLALELVSKCFGKRLSPKTEVYSRALKEFLSRKATASLSESLKIMRGRKRKVVRGRHHYLESVLESVVQEHGALFAGVRVPEITWSKTAQRARRLAFHDPALEQIVVNRFFDSPRVPDYVIRYLVFHELLHAKHEVLYERGESLRRTVHTRAFKIDERKCPQYGEAMEWIKRFY
ncbi:MAG: hypothetical protein NTY90_01430 [Candidatus Micrarchaeota archaeon]|nr:hypothetical protein [Candidatus Micrarchaeota archaeon]